MRHSIWGPVAGVILLILTGWGIEIIPAGLSLAIVICAAIAWCRSLEHGGNGTVRADGR
jgi:hypothetical protein